MLQYLVLLCGALAPSVFLLHFVYVRDKYEREPLRLMLRVYFFSFLTVIPVLVLQVVPLSILEVTATQSLASRVIVAFVVAGLIEEGMKFLFVRWLAFHRPELNEPYDGILYAVAVSLGFATIENMLYVLGAAQFGVSPLVIIVVRAVLAVPGHALWGVIMGSYIGRAKFAVATKVRQRLLLSGLLF